MYIFPTLPNKCIHIHIPTYAHSYTYNSTHPHIHAHPYLCTPYTHTYTFLLLFLCIHPHTAPHITQTHSHTHTFSPNASSYTPTCPSPHTLCHPHTCFSDLGFHYTPYLSRWLLMPICGKGLEVNMCLKEVTEHKGPCSLSDAHLGLRGHMQPHIPGVAWRSQLLASRAVSSDSSGRVKAVCQVRRPACWTSN